MEKNGIHNIQKPARACFVAMNICQTDSILHFFVNILVMKHDGGLAPQMFAPPAPLPLTSLACKTRTLLLEGNGYH